MSTQARRLAIVAISVAHRACGHRKDAVRSLQVVEHIPVEHIPMRIGHARGLEIILGIVLDNRLGHITHDMQGDIATPDTGQLIRQVTGGIGEQGSGGHNGGFLRLIVVRGLYSSYKPQRAIPPEVYKRLISSCC